MKNKKDFFIILAIFGLVFPGVGRAAMQSDTYVIYETVMHTFDGPIISNVSHSVTDQTVEITWDTNVAADSFVIYSTDSGFATSNEQGHSVKTSSSHSVTLSGLSANTTYYYRIRSERVNGGITTDTTARSFTTEAEDAVAPVTPPGGGGGILIIDKRDQVAPLVSEVGVSGVSYNSVAVSWTTDEEATSFVEYGLTADYGHTYGIWEEATEHRVIIDNLEEESNYNFRVLSSDLSGNLSYSDNLLFTTGIGEGEEAIIEEEEVPAEEEEEDSPFPLGELGQSALDFISRLFPSVSLNDLGGIGTVQDLTNFIDAPILSGEPVIDVSATQATIGWSTDIPSNSLIALAPDSVYNAGAAEPYQQIVGDPEEQVISHEVTLYNLQPDTLYHYQLRSKPVIGQTARSIDFTFQTSLEELSITSFFSQVIDDQTAIFKWVTNKESDTAITFIPYRGNVLALEEAKTIRQTVLSAIHEMTISEFVGGTYYNVEIISADTAGNIAKEVFERFSTTEDDLPPQISYIKTESTVFVDRSNKIQTVVSWLTNEPATSRVYFQEGVHGSNTELQESTLLNTSYVKEHVMVVTQFKPGIVYSFRVESIDSGGNITTSKTHTFMTAKKRDSIIDIILGILENTFGWLKKII